MHKLSVVVIIAALVVPLLAATALFGETRNILKPYRNSESYERQLEVYIKNATLGGLIGDKSHDGLNELADFYYGLIESGADKDKAFASYYERWVKMCIDCEIEKFQFHWHPRLRARDSRRCAEILKSREFMRGQDFITYTDPKTRIKYEIKTSYHGTAHVPLLELAVTEPGREPEPRPIAFPVYFPFMAAFYEKRGKLFFVNKSWAGTYFNVFEFQPEYGYFKEVCNIGTTIKGHRITFGRNNQVCAQVAGGKYQKYETKSITDILPGEDFDQYRKALCQAHAGEFYELHDFSNGEDREKLLAEKARKCHEDKDRPDVRVAWQTSGGSAGFLADYNNDGQEELLINAWHYGSAGPGCVFKSLYYVYDRDAMKILMITTGEPGNYHYDSAGRDYAISCQDGVQEIVKIGGTNYLLTLNGEGVERLHKVFTRPDGLNDVEEICVFAPNFEYE